MLARRERRACLGPHAALAAALAAAALAACSTVPVAGYPPFGEHHVAAEFVVPADGRLRVPASSASVLVQELRCEPRPRGEQFGAGGERWLLYPAGTAVRVRGRFRVYARADGHLPGAAELLPGASVVRRLDGP